MKRKGIKYYELKVGKLTMMVDLLFNRVEYFDQDNNLIKTVKLGASLKSAIEFLSEQNEVKTEEDAAFDQEHGFLEEADDRYEMDLHERTQE